MTRTSKQKSGYVSTSPLGSKQKAELSMLHVDRMSEGSLKRAIYEALVQCYGEDLFLVCAAYTIAITKVLSTGNPLVLDKMMDVFRNPSDYDDAIQMFPKVVVSFGDHGAELNRYMCDFVSNVIPIKDLGHNALELEVEHDGCKASLIKLDDEINCSCYVGLRHVELAIEFDDYLWRRFSWHLDHPSINRDFGDGWRVDNVLSEMERNLGTLGNSYLLTKVAKAKKEGRSND